MEYHTQRATLRRQRFVCVGPLTCVNGIISPSHQTKSTNQMYGSKTTEIHDPVNSDPQKSELENKNSVGSRPIAIYVARAPGQKRSNSAPLRSTASHPKGMLCLWGAWIGLGTDAVGGTPKGESQPYCTPLPRPDLGCNPKFGLKPEPYRIG